MASSAAEAFPRGMLAIRRSSKPSIVLMGEAQPELEPLLELQFPAFLSSCSHLHYVGYLEAQALCHKLAVSMRERLGREELAACRFAAIPRGGNVILGLLATVLDLDHRQLEPGARREQPLVLVDDCALSGARFAEQLEKYPHERIVFAHLCSPAPLRQAILEQEPRVEACLAAADLEVLSTLPEDHPSPDSRKRYWLGSTEALCFPWNEPDRMLYDSETESWQKAWPIVPPELCLKNRRPNGVEPLPVQIQPEARGPLRPTERVVFGDLDEKIVLADLESSQCFALTDSAAAMWRAMIEHGELDGITAAMAAEYDAPRDVLRRDAEEFLAELRQRGLVEG